MLGGKVLIDGDYIAYVAAFKAEKDSEEQACRLLDEIIDGILTNTTVFYTNSDYEVYHSGSSSDERTKPNFRYSVSPIYKANRIGKPKPQHLGACVDWLSTMHRSVQSSGEEADDLIAIRATELGPDTIIASVDKDFLQVPCIFYNIMKETLTNTSEKEGIKFLYTQMLTGDTTDNIKGAKGIGPKKAEKILAGCETEEELWENVVKGYNGNKEEAIMNARLVYLRRKVGEVWQPPDMR